MKIDAGLYNKTGYEFTGIAASKVQYYFDRIHKYLFRGCPPYRYVPIAYKLRKIVLFFYRNDNTINK